MTATVELPDNITEVASIYVSVGMGSSGTGLSYAYEGIDPESAAGYLRAVIRRLDAEADAKWADGTTSDEDFDFAGEVETFHFNCPSCHEDVDIDVDDLDALSFADDDEEEDT